MTAFLTEAQAYEAMCHFLEAEFQRSPSDGIGALLGAMTLQSDGGPTDPAVRQDWLVAMRRLRSGHDRLARESSIHSLEGAGLHDSVLKELRIEWQSGEVQASLSLVGGVPAKLLFHAVKSLDVPRAQPWGPSSAINAAKTLAQGRFEIELQSGDVLKVQAQGWSLYVDSSLSEA